MKILFYSIFLLLAVSFSSCQKDKPIINPDTKIEINGKTSAEKVSLAQDGSLTLKAVVENSDQFTVNWSVNGKEVSKETEYQFKAADLGEQKIGLDVINNDGGKSSSEITVNVYGKYKYGTFVLNEGNMTSENGSLTFISPEGNVTDSIYYKANNSFLGNVTQDLYITNGKMYIIAQNGNSDGGDGMLVVTNAETMKREAVYNDELSKTLSWPTHIAVIGQKAYIRDNKGVYVFGLDTKTLKFIEGSGGATKNRMAVVGDKVFVPAGKSVFVIQGDAIVHTITMPGTVSGVIKTSDNNLWVSCTSSPAQINKIKASDYSIIQTNEITETNLSAGVAATPGISAKGDTLYFSGLSTKIYRHIFSRKQTQYMTNVRDHITNAGIVYNTLAVHPKTGEVYFNTIKGFGWDFKINDITVFNFDGATPVLKADYKNHTRFPAGIFFTYDFN